MHSQPIERQTCHGNRRAVRTCTATSAQYNLAMSLRCQHHPPPCNMQTGWHPQMKQLPAVPMLLLTWSRCLQSQRISCCASELAVITARHQSSASMPTPATPQPRRRPAAAAAAAAPRSGRTDPAGRMHLRTIPAAAEAPCWRAAAVRLQRRRTPVGGTPAPPQLRRLKSRRHTRCPV